MRAIGQVSIEPKTRRGPSLNLGFSLDVMISPLFYTHFSITNAPRSASHFTFLGNDERTSQVLWHPESIVGRFVRSARRNSVPIQHSAPSISTLIMAQGFPYPIHDMMCVEFQVRMSSKCRNARPKSQVVTPAVLQRESLLRDL